MEKSIIIIVILSVTTFTYSLPSQSAKSAIENNLLKFKNNLHAAAAAAASASSNSVSSDSSSSSSSATSNTDERVPCTCSVFLTGQFKKGSSIPPTGNPALLYEQNTMLPCTSSGNKQCTNRCLDTIVKHLPNSPSILCGSVERDVHKERAYLFIQNCNSTWINTNLSAGREYCCKDNLPYKCPLI